MPDRHPPVFGVGDHVAHVEVVRQDPGFALEREAEVEQFGGGGVDAAHEHALVADVADADVEGGLGGLGDQWGERLGVVDVGVDGEVDATAGGGAGDAFEAFDDVGLQPVLGQAHEGLGGEPDVADRVQFQQAHEVRLEVAPGDVGHVAAGDDDVAYAGVGFEVADVGVVAVDGLEGEFELVHGGGGVADEVHAGAVPAVLGAGGEQLGEDLGGVAVGEPFGDPHVVLVEAVAAGVGV